MGVLSPLRVGGGRNGHPFYRLRRGPTLEVVGNTGARSVESTAAVTSRERVSTRVTSRGQLSRGARFEEFVKETVVDGDALPGIKSCYLINRVTSR